MTNQEINEAIAEHTGHNKLVGLRKRGMWWRPDAHGYTYNESEAWRITEEEAKKYARPNDFDAVTIERFKTPDYCNDLNLMHGVVQSLKQDPYERRGYLQSLDAITGDQWNTVDANARQRAEAFLRSVGKWRGE